MAADRKTGGTSIRKGLRCLFLLGGGIKVAVIDRKTYKKIEWHLYNYVELMQALHAQKEDIIEGGSRELTDWGGGISYRSDPAANKAIKLCKESILERELWLKVVSITLEKYEGSPKGELIRLKYFEELRENAICKALNIERSTYYYWREEVVTYAALVAAQEGLIKVA